MKSTTILTINVLFTGKDKVAIHPNDGFDLGLISPSNHVKLFVNCNDGQFIEETVDHSIVDLVLPNECKQGTIEMHKILWEKLGKPTKAIIKYHEGKIMIEKK